MKLFDHISYKWKVNRLALSLSKTERLISKGQFDVAAGNLLEENSEEDAKKTLFKLLQSHSMIRTILDQHGAGVDTLRDLYDVLARRVGGWRGNYYIPVHALAFPKPLDFLLSNGYQRFAREKFETIVDEVQLRITEYFAQGAPSDFNFGAD